MTRTPRSYLFMKGHAVNIEATSSPAARCIVNTETDMLDRGAIRAALERGDAVETMVADADAIAAYRKDRLKALLYSSPSA